MDFVIKKFTELSIQELYSILKLRNEVFVVEQNCVYQDCDNKDEDSFHIFSFENNEANSYIRVIEDRPDSDEIVMGRLVVSPKYRSIGLARKILITAIDFAKNKLNKRIVKISAQEYLFEFYSSVGFKKISDVYLEDNIPHVKMELDVNNIQGV